MVKCKSKVVFGEAVQFNNSEESVKEIKGMFPDDADLDTIEIGEWLVKEEGEEYPIVYTDEEFNIMYEIIN
jgi:hypothetical protein